MLNNPLIRAGLNTIGFSLPAWALVVVWFSLGAAVIMGIAGMISLLVAGFLDTDIDEGWWAE